MRVNLKKNLKAMQKFMTNNALHATADNWDSTQKHRMPPQKSIVFPKQNAKAMRQTAQIYSNDYMNNEKRKTAQSLGRTRQTDNLESNVFTLSDIRASTVHR